MKFSGEIGFWEDDVEVRPGIWKPKIIEKHYTGDVLRNRRSFQGSNEQNEELTIANRISILGDLYARENWPSICYILWKGVKWKVTSVEEDFPRLLLEIGGRWNENTKRSSDEIGEYL